LVIDDNDDLRHLMASTLGFVGHDPVSAASGAEGLALLRDQAVLPDAVVLDVQMPAMDGWSTLEAIRSQATLAHVPVIMCTVRSQSSDIVKGFQAGCDGYLIKPFDIDGFVATVERTVARDAAARQGYRDQMVNELQESS